jgi:hypothetical protein
MKRPFQQTTLLYTVIGLLLIFLLTYSGFFKPYAHLLSKDHLHRPNLLVRLIFLAGFLIVHHWVIVPRLLATKRYAFYYLAVIMGLVGMLVLPDFLIQQPKMNPDELKKQALPFSLWGLPVPLFEMVNLIIFYLLGVFVSAFNQIQQTAPPPMALPNDFLQEGLPSSAIETSPTPSKTSAETALTVTVNYSLMRIEFSDIIFIKSMDNYLHFYLKDKKPILVRMTFKEAAERLPTEEFLRVHKSYMVAIMAIESIRSKTIYIQQNEIPIGRAYETGVLQVFGK